MEDASKIGKDWFTKNTNCRYWDGRPNIQTAIPLNTLGRLRSPYSIIKSVWAHIPPETLQKFADSMPRRCQVDLDAKGYSRKY